MAIVMVKGTIQWGWGVGKLSSIRMRAAFGVAFPPFAPADYKRLGGKEWRRRSFRVLLTIDVDRLDIRPNKRGLRKEREDLSLPTPGITTIEELSRDHR
ncbi:hypothetical protein ACIBG8_28235 [Nonomuraea sp. NPDC050556]|uniref:hypothetical protein n=1 Tax=Nonomuraea sp. NPDC050556 TaxID=3364369 RepID=UPI0037B23B01